MSQLLPVHGFVLAGGKSSRMGQDKALLRFRGRPMVEIAVGKLRSFCAAVTIVGEREDLEAFAPVVRGERPGAGPAAGIEAGLRAATQDWSVFLPVDVPLLPEDLLRRWVEEGLTRAPNGVRLSFLRAGGREHPAICMVHRESLAAIAGALDAGMYKLSQIFFGCLGDGVWAAGAEGFVGTAGASSPIELWFANVNTPQELAALEGGVEAANTGMKY